MRTGVRSGGQRSIARRLLRLRRSPGRATQPAAPPRPRRQSGCERHNRRPAFVCTAPAEFARFTYPLRHTARRLAAGEPLTIVAIGSSSTAGAGASSPRGQLSEPARRSNSKNAFPPNDITVLNRGVNGEETEQMLARFDTGVIAAHPDLVLWQVGTNSVLRDHPLQGRIRCCCMKASRSSRTPAPTSVLMDHAIRPEACWPSPKRRDMEDQIALAAKEASVDLFNRFAVMRDWHEVQHMPFEAFVAPDSLHMNDWGYGCVAKLLARAIADAATRRPRRRRRTDALSLPRRQFQRRRFPHNRVPRQPFQRSFGITSPANISMLRRARSSGITPNCNNVIRMSKPVCSRTRSIFSRTVVGLPTTTVPLAIKFVDGLLARPAPSDGAQLQRHFQRRRWTCSPAAAASPTACAESC